jgi:menaquinol-cytochrome c reductase iron-sulfur subunit
MANETGASEAHESTEARHDDPETLRRRQFLNRLSLSLGGLVGVIISVPVLSFLLAPLLNPPEEAWQSVGPVDQYKVGETVEVVVEDPSPLPWAGVVATTAVWLRRETETQFFAFAVNCTHLGCPVRWLPDASFFMCPCHGGVFYQDGTVAGGPPPKPLPQYPVRLNGGQVEILAGASPLAGHD